METTCAIFALGKDEEGVGFLSLFFAIDDRGTGNVDFKLRFSEWMIRRRLGPIDTVIEDQPLRDQLNVACD